MTRLEITLTGILLLSMLFNVGVFVYARSAIQTLSHLLQHAISFNEQLETFEYIYSLTEDENLEPTDEETDEEEETEET